MPIDVDALARGLDDAERERLLDFCDLLLLAAPVYARSRRRHLDLIKDNEASPALKVAVGRANELGRCACHALDQTERAQATITLQAYRQRVADRVDAARAVGPSSNPTVPWCDLPMTLSDPAFIVRVYEVVLQAACRPSDLAAWEPRLMAGADGRAALLAAAFAQAALAEEAEPLDSSVAFVIMGTGRAVTRADWDERCARQRADAAEPASILDRTRRTPFFRAGGEPRVTVITSLYRGGEYIARFLDNLMAQTCDAGHAELIIVDAASPDGEQERIERLAARNPQLRYFRLERTVGIYEAWNLAISHARGEYLTNANVDDLRREDSLELQALALDARPDADIAYQDFYYSLDPTLSFEQVAALGFKTELPSIDAEVMLRYNPPHHAPMWRRRLHDELGLFDTRYHSAADYEFWLRCLSAGKRFVKVEEPHAVYYQNPQGVSTRPRTRSHVETRAIRRQYGRRLLFGVGTTASVPVPSH